MIVWVWRDCEPLPLDPGNPRLMRAGMFCAALAARGHRVRWFNSTFDHYQKRFRTLEPGSYTLDDGVHVELVDGIGYFSNGSPRRLLHNAVVAQRFTRRAHDIAVAVGERPDVLVADLPMPDSALKAVRLARKWGVPSVVSIRDLWPDFFLSFLSPIRRGLAKPFIVNLNRIVNSACREADHLIGISENYLAWSLKKAGRERREGDAIIPLGYAPSKAPHTEMSIGSLAAKGVDFGKDLATFVGSWGRTYDLKLLLEAAEDLKAEPGLQIVIAGHGEQGSALTEAAKMLPNVVLPGWLDRQEIATLLERSSVALAPYSISAPQGLPNKLFEYMAAGLFQVTTLRSEARTVLDASRAGLTVPAGNRQAFANAVLAGRDVGRDPAKRRAIKAYFSDHFAAERVYARYADELEVIVARRVALRAGHA